MTDEHLKMRPKSAVSSRRWRLGCTPSGSAKQALERIEKYLDAPLPWETKTVMCKAAIRKWRETGASR